MVRAMIGRFLVGFLLLLAFAPVANAQTTSATHRAAAVVELYTSQACGQCPQGNRFVGMLAQDPDVLALTFPVGIWDYLGWQDTFATPEFTERQRAFSTALRVRRSTPQLVLNGITATGVSDWDDARAMVDDARRSMQSTSPALTVTRLRSGRVRIVIGSSPRHEGADIWMVAYEPGPVSVFVTGGLNLNRRIYHYNLVRDLGLVGHWNGGPLYFDNVRCAPQCAILLQEPRGGRIIGASFTAPDHPVYVPYRDRDRIANSAPPAPRN